MDCIITSDTQARYGKGNKIQWLVLLKSWELLLQINDYNYDSHSPLQMHTMLLSDPDTKEWLLTLGHKQKGKEVGGKTIFYGNYSLD